MSNVPGSGRGSVGLRRYGLPICDAHLARFAEARLLSPLAAAMNRAREKGSSCNAVIIEYT